MKCDTWSHTLICQLKQCEPWLTSILQLRFLYSNNLCVFWRTSVFAVSNTFISLVKFRDLYCVFIRWKTRLCHETYMGKQFTEKQLGETIRSLIRPDCEHSSSTSQSENDEADNVQMRQTGSHAILLHSWRADGMSRQKQASASAKTTGAVVLKRPHCSFAKLISNICRNFSIPNPFFFRTFDLDSNFPKMLSKIKWSHNYDNYNLFKKTNKTDRL